MNKYNITDVSSNIFRGYDIRGLVDKELNEDVYYTLGLGYGTFLLKRRIRECAVGWDNRLNSEDYSKAFIAGLNETGINTYELGHSLSQIVYYSSYHFKTKAGAMITASHNPKEYNGMKLGIGYSDTLVSVEIQELREVTQSKKFSNGSGINTKIDIFTDYLKDVTKHFKIERKWKVVVDCCNTTSGKFYPEILRSMGCEVIELNCELDGNFPLGNPDPTESHVLERVSDKVKETNADIGFAYDSDGDRMAVVDEKARVFWMDSIVALFAKDVLDFLPNSKIVFNTLCSKQVRETIESCGGIPVMWRTGHSFIKSKIKEERAPFGGELSGHIFFMDNFYGHDDAAYATLRLMQYLERIGKTLGQAADELPHYISSPEIKLGFPDSKKFTYIDTEIRSFLEKEFIGAEFNYIDGVRFDTDDTMGTIRASQNGAYITIKFEAKTEDKYNQIKKVLRNLLSSNPEVRWDEGSNTHALD